MWEIRRLWWPLRSNPCSRVLTEFVSPNRGWTTLSSTNSATCPLKNAKPSQSSPRCFSTRSTTGSWRRPPRGARGSPVMTRPDTKPTTPGERRPLTWFLPVCGLLVSAEPSLCRRWLCYCNVPQFCDSLPRYQTTQIFGRTLLRSVFTVMRKQLLEQARQEKDKLPPEKRTLILTHFPK